MIKVHLSNELKSPVYQDLLRSLFNDSVTIYSKSDLTVQISECSIPNAFFDHRTNIVTVSVELIESMYAYTMATWLFHQNYIVGKSLLELPLSSLYKEDNFLISKGYYDWATKKYTSDYKTEMGFKSIIPLPIITSIISKAIAFIIGHELSHKVFPNTGNPQAELDCDKASIDNIVDFFSKDLFPIMFSISIVFLYFTSSQITTCIAFTGNHPDAWIRLKHIADNYKLISEPKLTVFIRFIRNLFRKIKLPSKKDNLFSYINSILIFTMLLEYPNLLKNWKPTYKKHENLTQDLFDKLSRFKKDFI